MSERATLSIWLFSSKSLANCNVAATVYELLDKSQFPPERFGEYEPIRKLWKERDQFLEAWDAQAKRNFGQVLWRRRTRPSYFGNVQISFGPASRRHVISIHGVSESNCTASILEGLLLLSDELFVTLGMDYGRVCLSDSHDEQNMACAITPKGTLGAANAVGMKWPAMIPGMYWINYFGPEYLRQGFAPELSSDDFYETKRFDNGAVRIRIAEDPRYFRTETGHQLEEHARDLLGSEWFFRKGDDRTPRELVVDSSVFAHPPSRPL